MRQPVLVAREVRWDPVKDHADAGRMERVDERVEIVWRAESARRCEVSDRLVSPRRVERMLGDREQLDMGETHRRHVVRELRRLLAIGHPAGPIFRHTPPGSQVHFIDGNRGVMRVTPGAASHPREIGPPEGRQIPDSGRAAWSELGRKSERVGLVGQTAPVRGSETELVERAIRCCRHEAMPDTRVPTPRHRVGGSIPSVEVSDHRDRRRVGRDDGEVHAICTVDMTRMRTQLVIGLEVTALRQQVQVVVGQIRFGHPLSHRRGRGPRVLRSRATRRSVSTTCRNVVNVSRP